MNRYFLTDTETTGLLKDGNPDFLAQPGIVQIAAVVLDENFVEIDFINTKVNPEIAAAAWEKKAIETHHIEPSMVEDAPTFFALLPDYARLATGATHWVGYNNAFDKKVLFHQLMRYGFETNFPWPFQNIDVMRLASNRMSMEGKRGTKNPKLSEIYEFLFPMKTFGAHDALEDCRATAEVLRELSK